MKNTHTHTTPNPIESILETEFKEKPRRAQGYGVIVCLPHYQFVDSYVKPVIKANKCRVVNHAGKSMRFQLVSNRPLRNEAADERAGVYKVPCQNCPQSYFEETGRPFKVRLEEHNSAVRNKCLL